MCVSRQLNVKAYSDEYVPIASGYLARPLKRETLYTPPVALYATHPRRLPTLLQSDSALEDAGDLATELVKDVDLRGKFVLITGANTGIGYETARALATAGAHVVLACRNTDAAGQAKDRILAEKPDAEVVVLSLDLSDMESVEAAAAEYLRRGWPLHILINNAGVVSPPTRITDAGFETTWQVNHLAHYYLVQLLTEKLISSAPSRIVIVASEAHRQPNVRFTPEQITWEHMSPTHKNGLNSPFTAYALSKTANVLHALHLNAALKDKGVAAFSLHPGVVRTEVKRNSKIMKAFFAISRPFTKSAECGAATSVFCAITEGLAEEAGGKYFADCRVKAATNAASNPAAAAKLAELSEEMIQHYKEAPNATQEPTKLFQLDGPGIPQFFPKPQFALC